MQNAITKQIVDMVDLLPIEEQKLVLEIVRRFVPDDVATEEDLTAIEAAREEYRAGHTVKHEDIHWE